MRMLLALALAVSTVVAVAPQPVSAGEAKRFEKPDLGVAFDYPAQWTLTQARPRNILPNETFNVQANGNATTGFVMAIYQLPAPVTEENLDTTFEQFDKQVQAWIAKLPGGTIVEIYDTIVEDADGREYSYEFQIDGQTIYGDLILIPLDAFDVILGSLVLPWMDFNQSEEEAG
jgi:hypothetical protein